MLSWCKIRLSIAIAQTGVKRLLPAIPGLLSMAKPLTAQPKGFVVQSVQRAMGILELLADCRAELTLTEIGARLELHPSTVHRLLGALVQSGFVQQDRASRKYHLGLLALKL